MKSGKEMKTEEIIKKLREYPCKHLVITGGEPLIQQQALKELLEQLEDYFVEMETSGSLKSHLDEYIDQYNCSPKLSNSENRSIRLEKLPTQKTFYKFVVSEPENIKEIKAFITKHHLPQRRIILMPEGIKKTELSRRSKWLVEICKQEGFRFSPRLHINIWGNKRKV